MHDYYKKGAQCKRKSLAFNPTLNVQLTVFQSILGFLLGFFLPEKLKRIDLTANEISAIDDKAFMDLPELEEVVIRENHISQLPALPETMTLIDASHNNIGSKGIHHEAFKVRTPSILTIIHVMPIRATITFQMTLLQIDCIIHIIKVILVCTISGVCPSGRSF